MVITARRRLVFQPSRYETIEIEHTLTDIPEDTDPEDITQQLDMIQAPEIQRARLASVHDPDDNVTSVYKWADIVGLEPEGD